MPLILIALGFTCLVADLLLSMLALPLLRARFKNRMIKQAWAMAHMSGIRIGRVRMKALEKEFAARIKEELNSEKMEKVLAGQRKALKKIVR